jgi:leucyl/phenylalanyl-tRNA---protein transferase
LSGVRDRLRRAVRPCAIALLRGLFRVVDPVDVGCWAARLARHPDRAAAELSRRVSSLVPPTAPDVVAGFARGLVLFGRPSSYGDGTGFEWCWYPVRAVITPQTARVPKNLRRVMRRGELAARFDQDFEGIIRQCQAAHGRGWLTDPLIEVYRDVHRLGFIRTIGMYRQDRLVSGIWGIELGRVFTAMSMFHTEDNSGAVLLGEIATQVSGGRWSAVDFGALNPNFARYGASEIPIAEFVAFVLRGLQDTQRSHLAAAAPQAAGPPLAPGVAGRLTPG